MTDLDITLGCEVLKAMRKPGECLSCEVIAEACGCSRNAISLIEHQALHKLRQKGLIRELYAAMFGRKPEIKEDYFERRIIRLRARRMERNRCK